MQEDASTLFSQGVSYYEAKDHANAFIKFTEAADQGHADAQKYLGNCYAHGHGVPQDYKQAVHWFCKAADQGHRVTLAIAITMDAECLRTTSKPSIGTGKLLIRNMLVLRAAFSSATAMDSECLRTMSWRCLGAGEQLVRAM